MEKLGKHEVIKRNYDYLLIAKNKGCFQDGFDKNDITTCTDWVIALWIDELGDLKNNKDLFENEIIPFFKRWYKEGLSSTGVGVYYSLLRYADINGIKINNNSFLCLYKIYHSQNLGGLFDNSKMNVQNDANTILFYEKSVIFDDLIRWQNNGVPITYETAIFYETFKELESRGKIIDNEIFYFFYTLGDRGKPSFMYCWHEKESYEDKYNLTIVSGEELERIRNWRCGYDSKSVEELETDVKKLKGKIGKYRQSSYPYESKLEEYYGKGKEIIVFYREIDSSNKEIDKTISGKLLPCKDHRIVIEDYRDLSSDEAHFVYLPEKDHTIIEKIRTSDGLTIYENKFRSEEAYIIKTENRIRDLKSQNLVTEYVDKFGTIKGLGYLSTRAKAFINAINPEYYPIDNLFAFCFEEIGSEKERDIRAVLYAYNNILKGKIGVDNLLSYNYGLPIKDFLSKNIQAIISNHCHYVWTNVEDDELPKLPVSPFDEDEVEVENKRGGRN